MSTSLRFASDIKVFPSPNCRETINTSMEQCPFCSMSIDHAAAEAAATATSRISHACSDASYLKIMLGVLVPFALLAFFPFFGILAILGFVFIKYATVVMAIRWWIKFRSIHTTDPDFRRARKTVIWVSAVALMVMIFLRVRLFGISV